MTSVPPAPAPAGLTIVRRFAASVADVFDAFASAEALAQWWGPAGSSISVLQCDFRPGGRFHYRLDGPGGTMWGLFVYRAINRPDLIEFVSSFADEAGEVSTSPFPMDFPLEILNRITLEEKDGGTILTLSGHPIGATAAQEETYRSIIPGMEAGFGGTLNQLERYLEAARIY